MNDRNIRFSSDEIIPKADIDKIVIPIIGSISAESASPEPQPGVNNFANTVNDGNIVVMKGASRVSNGDMAVI